MRRTKAFLAALVLLATSAASVLPAGAAAAGHCPDGQSCVFVTWRGDGNGSHTFDLDELDASVAQGSVQYGLCNPDAFRPCPPNPPAATDNLPCGVPIRFLIDALGSGIGPDAVATATIHLPGAQGTELSRSNHDLAGSSDALFPFIDTDQFGHKLYPIIFMNTSNLDNCSAAESIGFVRPQRQDTADPNYSDFFQTSTNGEIDIDLVLDRARLHPTITPPSKSIKAGTSVTFTAELPDDSPGNPSYHWYPTGDGDPVDTGADNSFAYTYDVAGRYRPYVVVSNDLGATGKSTPATISVGPKPTPSGTSTTPGHGTGSNQNPSDGPVSGSGLHGGAAPTTQVSGPHGPAAPHSGDHGQNGSASASGGTGTKSPSEQVEGNDGFVAVRGLILDPKAVPLPGATTASQHPEAAPAARRGASGDPESSGLGVGVVAAAAGMLLLVLGALGESRRPARSRPRRARP